MPNNKHIYALAPNGEEMFFSSAALTISYFGMHKKTLNKCLKNGKKYKGWSFRYEHAAYVPPAPVVYKSFVVHANVAMGMTEIANRRGESVSQLIRTAIFEMYPERYLFQVGADSPHGHKQTPYVSVGDIPSYFGSARHKADLERKNKQHD